MRRPRQLLYAVGNICEAGQHEACPLVGDPYDDQIEEHPDVWACSCECHGRPATGPDVLGRNE